MYNPQMLKPEERRLRAYVNAIVSAINALDGTLLAIKKQIDSLSVNLESKERARKPQEPNLEPAPAAFGPVKVDGLETIASEYKTNNQQNTFLQRATCVIAFLTFGTLVWYTFITRGLWKEQITANGISQNNFIYG